MSPAAMSRSAERLRQPLLFPAGARPVSPRSSAFRARRGRCTRSASPRERLRWTARGHRSITLRGWRDTGRNDLGHTGTLHVHRVGHVAAVGHLVRLPVALKARHIVVLHRLEQHARAPPTDTVNSMEAMNNEYGNRRLH